jgi:hypothetical protein
MGTDGREPLRWEPDGPSGSEREYDRANVFENCIACQYHDRWATDWLGQFSPTVACALGLSTRPTNAPPGGGTRRGRS